MIEKNALIIAKDQYYNMDCHETKLNNNVLVVGTSGSGKTRGIVIPNLLQASGSYIISDPKGNLYQSYHRDLKKKGYRICKLDFTNPEKSDHYNFFEYIHSFQDIIKIAHMIMGEKFNENYKFDPFWNQASELLLTAVIGYIYYYFPKKDRTIRSIFSLIEEANIEEEGSIRGTELDRRMRRVEACDPDSYVHKYYKKFKVGASKTLQSILIMITAALGRFDSPEINEFMKEDTIQITKIGREKTALFVVVSDTDRSMDNLVNLFFTQALNELCLYADTKCDNYRLPIDVRFILDDFATNCKIDNFERIISSIRSRGISTMLMIQSESQLEHAYGRAADTIIGNCDTYVYLGGNNLNTARAISLRCDIPLKKILYMPVSTNWIFRRGQIPVHGVNLELEEYLKEIQCDEREIQGEKTNEL